VEEIVRIVFEKEIHNLRQTHKKLNIPGGIVKNNMKKYENLWL